MVNLMNLYSSYLSVCPVAEKKQNPKRIDDRFSGCQAKE